MPCKCGHEKWDHKWKSSPTKREPCNKCKCKTFIEEDRWQPRPQQ